VIPCLMAGLRGSSIGTDTGRYLAPMYQIACDADSFKDFLSGSWFHIWQDLYVKDYEIGFSLLIYVITKLTGSLIAVQFVLQALIIIPVYLTIRRNKQKQVWLCMLVYYAMLYNTSLNLMRQAIAMAFALLAVQFFSENNFKYSMIVLFAGTLFHKSAILGVFICAIFYLTQKKISLKFIKMDSRDFVIVAILVGGILVLFNMKLAIEILQYFGIGRYAGYIEGDITFMPNQVLIRMPIILLLALNRKSLYKREKNFRFYLAMLCMELLCAQFTSVNAYSGRIALYFSQFHMLSFGAICTKGEYDKWNKMAVLGYLLVYWLFFFVFRMQDATVPYMPIWN